MVKKLEFRTCVQFLSRCNYFLWKFIHRKWIFISNRKLLVNCQIFKLQRTNANLDVYRCRCGTVTTEHILLGRIMLARETIASKLFFFQIFLMFCLTNLSFEPRDVNFPAAYRVTHNVWDSKDFKSKKFDYLKLIWFLNSIEYLAYKNPWVQ